MILVMREHASEEMVLEVCRRLAAMGLEARRLEGTGRMVLGVAANRATDPRELEMMPGVELVVPLTRPWKRVGRESQPGGTRVRVGDVIIGGPEVVVMAGPCSVENREQVRTAAAAVRRGGARILRGGAFKPRSSPESFQGLGEEGLAYLREAADAEGLALVTEVMDQEQIPIVSRYADLMQVGARNMHNTSLLRALGQVRKPVLLKRGFSATVEELLLAAEYILHGGNPQVILCERGIRTFETATRYTLDLAAIPTIQTLSHLPIVVDPSHATGYRDKVAPLARAAVACGADGLLIEVHPDPAEALSDGPQSLYPGQFERLMDELRRVAGAVGRSVHSPQRDS